MTTLPEPLDVPAYQYDEVDAMVLTVRRVRRMHNEYPPARFDPMSPLGLLLHDQRPSCAQDPLPDKWVDPGRDHQAIALMKRICDRCPLKGPCLQFALTFDCVGVWGGTTTRERLVLRAEQAARLRRLREGQG